MIVHARKPKRLTKTPARGSPSVAAVVLGENCRVLSAGTTGAVVILGSGTACDGRAHPIASGPIATV